MEKREKIMLGVVAATVVVAAALHFSTPPPAPDATAQGGAQVNLEEVNKTVEQAKLSNEQAYRITVLTQQLAANPFFGETGALSQEEASGLGAAQGTPGEYVYSGYMKVGQKIYAVINGMEYALGDELADGGYVVQSIDKTNVLLERTDGSTGRKYTKRISLVEDDTDKIRIRVVKKR